MASLAPREHAPSPRRILVLGASGGCGRWVVQRGAARGHAVTAAVRPSSPYEAPAGALLRQGEVLDESFLRAVVPGHDVVVSCLGLRRAGISPWGKLLSPADLLTRAMQMTTEVMATNGVSRLIVISAGGVGSSRGQTNRVIRRVTRLGSIRTAYRDLGNMERHLEATTLDWIAVRPVTLGNGEPREDARVVERYGLFARVRRSDVALWIVKQVEEPTCKGAVLLGR